MARSSFASRSLVLLSLAPRRMAPERSRPERSRPESFLPARSAGWRAVAEATAASTSARVISADAISGDARSTCCIMPWEAAGMAHARPNIPIAPIRIDARLIVSLYLGAVAAMTNGPSSLSPSGYARDHLHDHVLATVAGMRARHLSRSIERITWFPQSACLADAIKGKPAMTLLRGARRLGLALVAAAAQLPADAAELTDYPTAARADYVFACMKTNGDTREALERCSCSIDVIASLLPYDAYVAAATVASLNQEPGRLGGEFRGATVAREALARLR